MNHIGFNMSRRFIMSKCRIMVAFLLLVIYGCASERLYIKVVDDEGAPVSNATVNVGFSS